MNARIVKDSAAEYHAVKALSNSGISKVLQTPAHFKAWQDGEANKQTEAMFFGQMFHGLTLEPEIFETAYGVYDRPGNTKEGIAQVAVATMKDGKVIFRVIDRKDVQRAQRTSASLQGEKKQYSPWTTSPDAMWMKTAIKRLCSFLPRTEQLSLAIELDDKAERGESQLPEVNPTVALNDALAAQTAAPDIEIPDEAPVTATARTHRRCPEREGALVDTVDDATCNACKLRSDCPAHGENQ